MKFKGLNRLLNGTYKIIILKNQRGLCRQSIMKMEAILIRLIPELQTEKGLILMSILISMKSPDGRISLHL